MELNECQSGAGKGVQAVGMPDVKGDGKGDGGVNGTRKSLPRDEIQDSGTLKFVMYISPWARFVMYVGGLPIS